MLLLVFFFNSPFLVDHRRTGLIMRRVSVRVLSGSRVSVWFGTSCDIGKMSFCGT